MRGRGGPTQALRPNQSPVNNYQNTSRYSGSQTSQFVPHLPFDPILCDAVFPRVSPMFDENTLNQALLKRNQELTPSTTDQAALLALVQKVQTILDNIVLAPPPGWDVVIEEVRQVGSHKKQTMVAGHNVADMVAVLRILPTIEAVGQLGKKISDEVQLMDKHDMIQIRITDSGCEIWNPMATVNLLITTAPTNLRQLDKDLHLDYKPMVQSMAAIRHSRWFDENATHSRRCLQLLSAGFFLPGSVGILDPCESGNVRVHTTLSLEQQDMVCYTAQTLLRVLAQGGYKKVIGLDPDTSIAKSLSVWNQSVVVSPSVQAYEPPAEPEEKPQIDNDQPTNPA